MTWEQLGPQFLQKKIIPCPSYFWGVPPLCQACNFFLLLLLFSLVSFLLISCISNASHLRINLALVPCVGMYPSRSRQGRTCGRDHSRSPTSSGSEIFASLFPLRNNGKQLLILEMAAAVFLADNSAASACPGSSTSTGFGECGVGIPNERPGPRLFQLVWLSIVGALPLQDPG